MFYTVYTLFHITYCTITGLVIKHVFFVRLQINHILCCNDCTFILVLKGTVLRDCDRLKGILLDRSIVGEEPLVVFKIFQCSFD
jgi:hypothetical protein